MADTLLFALPEAPDRERRATHWWHVVDGELLSAGTGDEWLTFVNGRRNLVGIAPTAQVRLGFNERPSSAQTRRQAETVARVAAVNSSLGKDDELHSASAVVDDGSIVTAVTAKDAMTAWLDWARQFGADPTHVVPAGALLPLTANWNAATFGDEHVIGRRGTVFPGEPELASAIVGDSKVEALDEEQVRSALAHAAEAPPINLRTGRFARRRNVAMEGKRIRQLAILAALIPVVLLAWALVVIFKLERSTARLDSEALAVAEAALGRPVTLETAESELAQRAGSSAYGGLMVGLTAVYQALQQEQSVSATGIAYAPDGTLSVTFAAPNADAVNRVLVGLQRGGYRVTAVPRQSPDGRSLVETTVR
ncbi:MAG TPA: type II secretion system protein GspL, partial [Sphingomicrobium sp.]|nr:type II secretion system protein GspL [Sphingomicrobium sp.]